MRRMASPVSADPDPVDVRRARSAITRLHRAELAVQAARQERDEAIARMLEQGASLGRIATLLGVSRALVYQTDLRVRKALSRAHKAAQQEASNLQSSKPASKNQASKRQASKG